MLLYLDTISFNLLKLGGDNLQDLHLHDLGESRVSMLRIVKSELGMGAAGPPFSQLC